MDENEDCTYWCHMCSQTVNPIVGLETIKCPVCESGFVEEMSSEANDASLNFRVGDSGSDRGLPQWAPILLGMMGNRRRRRRFRGIDSDEEEDVYDSENNPRVFDEETDLDHGLESLMRRRNSAAILELLQGIRAGLSSDSGDSRTDEHARDRTDDGDEEERVILINPFSQTVVIRGSHDPSRGTRTRAPTGSLGDYFVGPGLDLLLQHLAENDPNRYGTPPADKKAVEALATVKIEESGQCSVCLDDFEVGTEVKEMPCKHKFHGDCLLPWLELHSSCPVCRHQLPFDESKIDRDGLRNDASNNNNVGNGSNDDDDDDGGEFSVPLPWPFSSFFLSSGSQSGADSSSRFSRNEPSSSSHQDED